MAELYPISASVVVAKSVSTPVSDKNPAQGTGREFEIEIEALRSTLAGFARSIIKDPAARAAYIKQSQAAVAEIIDLVKQGKITPHEGAQTAHAMRNHVMALARAKLTDFGLTVSKGMKADGRTFESLEEQYALRLFKRAFSTLSKAERDAVFIQIVHSAGAPRGPFNVQVRYYGLVGRGLLIASLALAVYNVVEAEDKVRQASKEGVGFGAGLAGGAAGGAVVVALVSNPVGWVVGAVVLVTAALSGVGAEKAFDYYWPEKK